ncbi:MAG: DUF6498-containing protein [Anaerolineales bacterium]|nr:DUF6498-containing protein [Anaerolineales bacterium]
MPLNPMAHREGRLAGWRSLYEHWGEALAFGISAVAALVLNWQAPDLAWGLWISSLLTGWMVVAAAALRMVLHASGAVALPEGENPFGTGRFQGLLQGAHGGAPSGWTALLLGLGAIALGLFTLFHFTFFHGVQGAVMSVFLPIEPEELFGPDGFINAEAGDILRYLTQAYFPVILATLIARWKIILRGNPVDNMSSVYGTVARLHIFIILSAFLSVLIVFGAGVYQQVLVLTFLFLVYFPSGRRGRLSSPSQSLD